MHDIFNFVSLGSVHGQSFALNWFISVAQVHVEFFNVNNDLERTQNISNGVEIRCTS